MKSSDSVVYTKLSPNGILYSLLRRYFRCFTLISFAKPENTSINRRFMEVQKIQERNRLLSPCKHIIMRSAVYHGSHFHLASHKNLTFKSAICR